MESIRPRRGFTLIELMVVLAIIAIITAVAITSQSAFNKTLVLANTAYDVALTLRSAETYGLGSRAISGITNTGYGVDFNSGTPASFTLFADTYPSAASGGSLCHPSPSNGSTAPDAQPGDCAYEPGQDVKVANYALGNGITINNFCAETASAWVCANASSGAITSLDVVFSRPNAAPFMSVDGTYAVPPVTAACLELTSPQGGARFVSVNATGEITANASSCP